MSGAAAEIVFDHVTKRYPGRAEPAVSDLTLTVPAGEICCLVGPSGAGKTTAMRLVNRLIDFDEGDITIGGQSVRALDLTELRRGIGYVIQQVGLFPHMTVAENVATVPRLRGWEKKRIAARVDELLDLVDLPADDYRARFATQLSGGERQRVGLARALAADPPAMLMDEPFGALDPITRARLQHELLRIQGEVRKTIVFVTHDIDEAILLADKIAILREGGVLAQYDTPERILEQPADEFVERFIGSDRGIKLLSLRRLDELELAPLDGEIPLRAAGSTSLRDALSQMITHGSRALVVVDDAGAPQGVVTLDALAQLARMTPVRPVLAQKEPVIPDFGEGSDCVTENRLFCPDWVQDNWAGVIQPALLEHVKLTLIAVAIGFLLAFVAAVATHRYRLLEGPVTVFSAVVYTIPSLALFQLLVPVTGLTVTTVEIALVGYTLLILFRNTLEGLRGVPPEVLEAARGMGYTRSQTLWRVELPLAVPAMFAGLRVAVVSTIALATVAALVIPEGLGYPIFLALREAFKTEIIVAGGLAVALALVADALLVLLQRALTPWARARRAA